MTRGLEVRVWGFVMMFLLMLEESRLRRMSLWSNMRHRICCWEGRGRERQGRYSLMWITATIYARFARKMGGELWISVQHPVNILGIVYMLAAWTTVTPHVI